MLSFLGLPTLLLVMKTCTKGKQNYQNPAMYLRPQELRRKLLDINRKIAIAKLGRA